jgi:hypothetical protein
MQVLITGKATARVRKAADKQQPPAQNPDKAPELIARREPEQPPAEEQETP